MKIGELFKQNVTRNIPPVVYFHEQSPERLRDEVSEYIVTGGYPAADPRHKKMPDGIHEQFVRLCRNVRAELDKDRGPELPTVWIAGFFGSGKSSFAKLFGFALDNRTLPDGTPLAEALLRRDDTPLGADLRAAWSALLTGIDPIAVVFDIGSVARDNEHIHSVVVRQLQARLGYAAASPLVADYELKLEKDGQWDRFLAMAQTTLAMPWAEAQRTGMVEDHFSHVLHALFPDRYTDPTSWFDSRGGTATTLAASSNEAVAAIDAMMRQRAAGKTLFVVVDEVSQYVGHNNDRIGKLQSFASELGARLHGQVWLLVTAQEKLEEATVGVFALKDRFPPHLRVHLGRHNIRDVVHRRLLRKAPEKESALRELFRRHRSDLELYAYGCRDGLTEEDFVETYPLLPGYVDLILQITSAVRQTSTRVQGDQYAVRGLLQLLGEIFRQKSFAERDVGDLITFDVIFDVQQSSLDSDLQVSMTRVLDHCAQKGDELAGRAAKAVALLQYIQDLPSLATTAALVASCLYDRLEPGRSVQDVEGALERLRAVALLSYSEKQGYKLQSSAGEEWQKEREDFTITADKLSESIRDELQKLVAVPELPRYRGRKFAWYSWYSDTFARDVRLDRTREEAVVYLDFRILRQGERGTDAEWLRRSDDEPYRDRVLWIAGQSGDAEATARELGRSQKMVARYDVVRDSLPPERQRLLIDEKLRVDDLHTKLSACVAAAWLEGRLYFRGRPIAAKDRGRVFSSVLLSVAEELLPDLYPHFTNTAVTETELMQLVAKSLSGPSTKFMPSDLGILALDAGKYVASCAGMVPARILAFIEERKGTDGSTLFAHFGKPPYGYPSDVIKACLAGLLRGGKVRIQPEQGAKVTSVLDPGVQDLFRQDQPLRRAEIFPADEGTLTGRDRVAICTFFREALGVEDLERENDAIADATYQQLPGRSERLRDVARRLGELPGRPPLPPILDKLGKALEDCRRSRQVEDTVKAVKDRLGVLKEGLQLLGIFDTELTPEAIAQVKAAAHVADVQLAHLSSRGPLGELEPGAERVRRHLASDRPWRDIAALEPDLDAIRAAYVAERQLILQNQARDAQAARDRLKARDGFALLGKDAAHDVLRPIQEALTAVEAVGPSLVELRTVFPARMAEASETSHDLLDEALEKLRQVPVVKVSANLIGREFGSRVELDAALDDLRTRLGKLIDDGKRVRII